jgi:hypothetical protein
MHSGIPEMVEHALSYVFVEAIQNALPTIEDTMLVIGSRQFLARLSGGSLNC